MSFENLENKREQFGEENDIRAEERNKHRTLSEKLMFKNKATGLDVAEEEAVKMGKEAEKLVQSGEPTLSKAIKKLNTRKEFSLKGKEQLEKEEYVRAEALRVAAKIEEGDFAEAREILLLHSLDGKLDRKTQELVEKAVMPVIKKRLIKDIETKKGDDLVKLIENLQGYVWNITESVDLIRPEDLREVPVSLLRSPEIVGKIQDFLVDSFKKEPNIFDRVLEKYIELGFVTKREIVTSPKIKETAKALLMTRPLQEEAYTDSASSQLRQLFRQSTFDELKKIFMELGIFSGTEIEKIRSKRLGR